MGKKIFTASKEMKSEYACSVVRIGSLIPIQDSDFLAQTFIGDASIVVRKDQVKEGELYLYAPNESQLSDNFLSANNLFGMDCCEKNSNYEDVKEFLEAAEICKKDGKVEDAETFRNKAKSMCGFFAHNGRVRMIRLKKTPSMGYLFNLKEMGKLCPKAQSVNLEEYLNQDFDTVDGEVFIKAYVPPVKVHHKGTGKKRDKKIERFDRMIPGEFAFHYDTQILGKNMWRLNPTDEVTISNKLHGTSYIGANIKIKTPLPIPFYKRWWNKFVDITGFCKNMRVTDYTIDYDNVYSSRSVIKNQFINKEVGQGYYKFDIWREANEILKPYITKDMTIYAEICGWADKTMIQKGYDYGCKEGEFFIMPYRIVTKEVVTGGMESKVEKYEWNAYAVEQWTQKLLLDHPELKGKVVPLQIFYHGTLQNLYPGISVTEHWHENVLQAMMNDKEHFGMEGLEPLCKNKVPREGIVLRIHNDPTAEAFKLKCTAFREREAKAVDKGEVDIEMQEGFCNESEEV